MKVPWRANQRSQVKIGRPTRILLKSFEQLQRLGIRRNIWKITSRGTTLRRKVVVWSNEEGIVKQAIFLGVGFARVDRETNFWERVALNSSFSSQIGTW